ncbi:hypothetical protein B0T20DRAFT_406525 [Sordaria brevicollis]|uniref:Uncharacterized protein n=1 Tax=Sordaria brevicollis TaxID=83679 RepID=A0AAE0UDA4_SORBR|nr:hypothetical protein B0T20DRAFT_406525 [Sordaria brevicollis]
MPAAFLRESGVFQPFLPGTWWVPCLSTGTWAAFGRGVDCFCFFTFPPAVAQHTYNTHTHTHTLTYYVTYC